MTKAKPWTKVTLDAARHAKLLAQAKAERRPLARLVEEAIDDLLVKREAARQSFQRAMGEAE